MEQDGESLTTAPPNESIGRCVHLGAIVDDGDLGTKQLHCLTNRTAENQSPELFVVEAVESVILTPKKQVQIRQSEAPTLLLHAETSFLFKPPRRPKAPITSPSPRDGRYAFVQNTLLNLPGMSDGSITVVDLKSESVVRSVDTLKNAGYNPNSLVLLPQWNDLAGH